MKETDRRLTPAWVLDALRDELGHIELDPCTEPDNPTGAARFMTLRDDGLVAQWPRSASGFIWVNPPFSALGAWAAKVADHGKDGREIVALTPLDSTTRWWAALSGAADVVAPFRRRVAFAAPGEAAPKSAAKSAACLWYFGFRAKLFACSVREIAWPMLPRAVWP